MRQFFNIIQAIVAMVIPFNPSVSSSQIAAGDTPSSPQNPSLTNTEEECAPLDEVTSNVADTAVKIISDRSQMAYVSFTTAESKPKLENDGKNTPYAAVKERATPQDEIVTENVSSTAILAPLPLQSDKNPLESLKRYLFTAALLKILELLSSYAPKIEIEAAIPDLPPALYQEYFDKLYDEWRKAVASTLTILDLRLQCSLCTARGIKHEMTEETRRLRLALENRLSNLDPTALGNLHLREEIVELLESVERTFWTGHAAEWLNDRIAAGYDGHAPGRYISVYGNAGQIVGVVQGAVQSQVTPKVTSTKKRSRGKSEADEDYTPTKRRKRAAGKK